MPTITVNDELSFEVDDNFVNLPKEEQQRIVDEAVIQDASEGAGRAFLKGMLFNFRDEVSAILSEPMSFIGDGEEYRKALTRERALESAFQAQAPATAIASELGGGLITPAGALGAAVKGGSMLYRGLKAAGAGAGLGALAGAGAGEDAQDRLSSAVTGGAIGAAVAPAATALVPATKYVGGLVTKPIARIAEASASDPQNRAARMIARRLKDAGISGKELEALKKSPKPEAIADLDSSNIQSLSRLVAQSSGRGAEMARALNSRQFGTDAIEGAAERIEKDLIAAGAPSKSAQETLSGLDQIKKEKASALYEKAFSRPVPPQMRSEIKGVYDRIKNSGALNNAQQIARTEGRPFTGEPLNTLSFQDMQYIQRSLRGLSSKEYRAGNAELGKALKELRDEFVDAIDKYNPDFKSARGVYADAEAAKAAVDAGRKFRTYKDAGEIKQIISKMTNDELHHFRVGVAQTLRNEIEAAASGRNLASVLSNSKRKLRQLQEAFPEKGFKQLEDALDKEAVMASKRTSILGGSQTFQTGQVAEETAAEELGMLQQMARGFAREGVGGGVAPLMPAGQRALMGIGKETDEQLGRMLFATDPAARARAIEQVRSAGSIPLTGGRGAILPETPPAPSGLLGRVGQAAPSAALRGLLFQAPTMSGRELMNYDGMTAGQNFGIK